LAGRADTKLDREITKSDQPEPLFIIIPCFDEEKTIYRLLEKCRDVDVTPLGLRKKIILVDDGSADGSPQEIERFRNDNPDTHLCLLTLQNNRGKGYAIRHALEMCEGGIVIIQDADFEYYPEQFPLVLEPVVRGMSDVAYGSRWINPGAMSVSGALYFLGGWLENRYLHLLYRTNISDIATCYKAFRTDLIKTLDLECTGFEFCPEVTAKLLNRGVKIIETPIKYKARKKHEGKKIGWLDFVVAIYTLTRLRFRRK